MEDIIYQLIDELASKMTPQEQIAFAGRYLNDEISVLYLIFAQNSSAGYAFTTYV